MRTKRINLFSPIFAELQIAKVTLFLINFYILIREWTLYEKLNLKLKNFKF